MCPPIEDSLFWGLLKDASIRDLFEFFRLFLRLSEKYYVILHYKFRISEIFGKLTTTHKTDVGGNNTAFRIKDYNIIET